MPLPPLGIFDKPAGGGATSFESIATVTVGSGGASTITFSSIPSTYTHLQVRYLARTNRTSSDTDAVKMTFNSDTGANYSNHQLYGLATGTVGAYGGANESLIYVERETSDGAASSIFGVGVIDILDYANTNKYKTARILAGCDLNNTSGQIHFDSGSWRSTNAITSINFTPNTGSGFVQYSSFALYGIKSA